MKTGSVKELFAHYKGTAPGFDALRLILASAILIYHAIHICQTYHPISSAPFPDNFDFYDSHELWLKPLARSFLLMFFFMGGFLVTGSALRVKSLKVFMVFRFFRVAPALFVEVVLSALLLGAFYTTLPLNQYYTHPQFFKYFLNIVGDVQFYLPGVFTDGAIYDSFNSIVNGNLWTMPLELLAYAIIGVLALLHLVSSRRRFLGLFILISLIVVAIQIVNPHQMISQLTLGINVAGFLQIYSFMTGACVYLFSEKIFISKKGIFLAVISLTFLKWDQTIILGVWAACYLSLCAGFMNLKKLPIIRHGDYSYGVYLYGFPIERGLYISFPILREWLPLACAAMSVTLVLAIFSWHLVEKPVLELKRKLWPKIGHPHLSYKLDTLPS